MARFFRSDGKYLARAYKEHLSDSAGGDQRAHADEWMLLPQNMGERLSIDESMLHRDLFTFLSNKDGHGKRGTLIASVRGTCAADVVKRLMKIPEDKRLAVKEVTMDFSDSMFAIVSKAFPNAEIVIDCFHIMQLAGNGLEEMRLKLKRAARTEAKREEREFKEKQAQRAELRSRYAKTHKPKESKNGKRLGRPRKRRNEKFYPAKLSNGETKVDLLTHVRCPLLQSGADWSGRQKERMKILFEMDNSIKNGYGFVCKLCCIFKKRQSRGEAVKDLHQWYKDVGKSLIRELISVRDTIQDKEEYVLNYFNQRSINASAESLNLKIKGFLSQVHGVADLPFFLYRMMKIFG